MSVDLTFRDMVYGVERTVLSNENPVPNSAGMKFVAAKTMEDRVLFFNLYGDAFEADKKYFDEHYAPVWRSENIIPQSQLYINRTHLSEVIRKSDDQLMAVIPFNDIAVLGCSNIPTQRHTYNVFSESLPEAFRTKLALCVETIQNFGLAKKLQQIGFCSGAVTTGRLAVRPA